MGTFWVIVKGDKEIQVCSNEVHGVPGGAMPGENRYIYITKILDSII